MSVAVVDIHYPVTTDEGVLTLHTWTAGPTVKEAIRNWKKAMRVRSCQTEVLCSGVHQRTHHTPVHKPEGSRIGRHSIEPIQDKRKGDYPLTTRNP